jgi:hypothetical protein
MTLYFIYKTEGFTVFRQTLQLPYSDLMTLGVFRKYFNRFRNGEEEKSKDNSRLDVITERCYLIES